MGIFKSKRQSNSGKGGKTIIADGCVFHGEITEVDGPLHIDGRVEGVIDTQFDLSVGLSGQVNGVIKAKNIALSGCLDGEITCESIVILPTGKLIGDLICVDFTVETGGKFIGQSHELTEDGSIVSLTNESSVAVASTQKEKLEEAEIIEDKPSSKKS